MIKKKVWLILKPHVCDVTVVIVLTLCVLAILIVQKERHMGLNFDMKVKWKEI